MNINHVAAAIAYMHLLLQMNHIPKATCCKHRWVLSVINVNVERSWQCLWRPTYNGENGKKWLSSVLDKVQ